MKLYQEVREVVAKLRTLEMSEELAEFGPRVLEIMKGVSVDAFWEIDEKPGRYNYLDGRFYMLRRVRNDCHTETDFGNKMFANLTNGR